MGAPFLPVRGILGSIYPEVNADFKVIPDPFSGEEMVVVKALKPDVTLVHGSKGDESGNILIPRLADWPLAIRASQTVIATVEERVAGPLREEADWRLVPGHSPQRPGALPRRGRAHRLSRLLRPGRGANRPISEKRQGAGGLG